MRFRLDYNITLTEYDIRCAIAEILESNNVRHIGAYAKIKLNDKNILNEIKTRVLFYGENGLGDTWRFSLGYTVWEEAGRLVSQYEHLVD